MNIAVFQQFIQIQIINFSWNGKIENDYILILLYLQL